MAYYEKLETRTEGQVMTLSIFSAILSNKVDVVNKSLAEDNKLLKARDREQLTPLMLAILEDKKEVFDLFIDKLDAEDVSAEDGVPNSVIIYAAGQANSYYMDRLFDKFVSDLNQKNLQRAYIYYAERGDKQRLQHCLNHNVDINSEYLGSTAYSQAIKNGHEQVAIWLLSQPQTNINLANYLQQTPLIDAIVYDKKQVVEFLLAQEKIDLHHKSYFFSTALVAAIFKQQYDWVLQIKKQDKAFSNELHPVLFYWLIRYGRNDLIREFIDTSFENTTHPPLAIEENSEMSDWLISEEAGQNVAISYETNTDCFDPLPILAVKYENLEAIKIFLKVSKDFEQLNSYRRSVYWYDKKDLIEKAKYELDREKMEQLCNHLKNNDFPSFKEEFPQLNDKNIIDNQGRTILHHVLITPSAEEFIEYILQDPDSNLNVTDEDHRTPLLFALSMPYIWFANIQNLFAVQKTTQLDLDLTIQEKEGNNALHLAVINKHLSIIHLLHQHANDYEILQAKEGGKSVRQLATNNPLINWFLEKSVDNIAQIEQINLFMEDSLYLSMVEFTAIQKAACWSLFANKDMTYNVMTEVIKNSSLGFSAADIRALEILSSLLKQKDASPYYQTIVTKSTEWGELQEKDILEYYQLITDNFCNWLLLDVDPSLKDQWEKKISSLCSHNQRLSGSSWSVTVPSLSLLIEQITAAIKTMEEKPREESNLASLYLCRGYIFKQLFQQDQSQQDLDKAHCLFKQLASGNKNLTRKNSYLLKCLACKPNDEKVLLEYIDVVKKLNNSISYKKALERINNYLKSVTFNQQNSKVLASLQYVESKQLISERSSSSYSNRY